MQDLRWNLISSHIYISTFNLHCFAITNHAVFSFRALSRWMTKTCYWYNRLSGSHVTLKTNINGPYSASYEMRCCVPSSLIPEVRFWSICPIHAGVIYTTMGDVQCNRQRNSLYSHFYFANKQKQGQAFKTANYSLFIARLARGNRILCVG